MMTTVLKKKSLKTIYWKENTEINLMSWHYNLLISNGEVFNNNDLKFLIVLKTQALYMCRVAC